MARGPGPDWRREEAAATPVWDMGELAARFTRGLGIDRAGAVAFSSGFEDNSLAEFQITPLGGAGGAVIIDSANTNRGKYSAKANTGATIGSGIQIARYFLPIEDQKPIGIEVAVDLNGQAGPDLDFDLGFYCSLPSLGKDVEFSLRLNLLTAAMKLQYLNDNWTFTDIETISWLNKDQKYWHSFKMVVNPWTYKYVRAVLDFKRWDLSTLLAGPMNGGTRFYFNGTTRLYARAAVAKVVFEDDFILTGNESR